jgi:hypothetical protein
MDRHRTPRILLGQSWTSGTGDLYNEHPTRDVGGLFTTDSNVQ